LCPDDSDAWSYGRLSNSEDDPDFWPELASPAPLRGDEQVETIVVHIRNALAHGNLFTQGEPIKQLVFVSKPYLKSKEYHYLLVDPDEFTSFLHRWFEFVTKLKMPHGVAVV